MIDLKANLAARGEPESFPSVAEGWEESMASLPALAPFVSDSFLRDERLYSGLEEAWDPLLASAARSLREDPFLHALAWHAHRRAFVECKPVDFLSWPTLERPLRRQCRLFYLIVALSSFPLTREKHRQLGVPEEISRATVFDLEEKCRRSSWNRPDLPGLAAAEVGWFQNHVAGNVFTVGRLQYWPRPFRWDITAFRNRRSGEYLALAPDGARFTASGLLPRIGEEAPDGWDSRLDRTPHAARGHPIRSDGYAIRRLITLDANDWEPLFSRGDPVYEIHIPAGGKMTLESCRKSMIRARDLFRRIFPCLDAKAFACVTWFLGPQMQEVLPCESNIVRFQKACYLFPVSTGANNGLYFLFGTHHLPEALRPGDSSLRRAVWKHIRSGGDWRGGGMFFPVSECERFGELRFQGSDAGNTAP